MTGIRFAAIILSLTLPLTYCEIRRQEGRDAVEIECIKAGGYWRWNRCQGAV